MGERVKKCGRGGLQVRFTPSAMGKRTTKVLKTFWSASKENGDDRRFRIEHAQHLRLDDIAFRRGRVASMSRFTRLTTAFKRSADANRLSNLRFPNIVRYKRDSGFRVGLAGRPAQSAG